MLYESTYSNRESTTSNFLCVFFLNNLCFLFKRPKTKIEISSIKKRNEWKRRWKIDEKFRWFVCLFGSNIVWLLNFVWISTLPDEYVPWPLSLPRIMKMGLMTIALYWFHLLLVYFFFVCIMLNVIARRRVALFLKKKNLIPYKLDKEKKVIKWENVKKYIYKKN